MRKLLSSLFIIFAGISYGNAQIIWQSNLDNAINLAKASNRLILIDFWANWCGPCHQMDKDVWQRDEMNKVIDKFVFAKVDIDYNRTEAASFGIRSIPAIFVVDVERNHYYEIKGYKDLEYMLGILEQFPDNMTRVYEKMHETDSWEDHLDVAMALLFYGQEIENVEVKKGFVSAANNHLRAAGKLVKGDPSLEETIAIYELVALSQYNGKKALKKLDKLYEQSTGENEDLFNYAYCCGLLEEGDKNKAKKYYDQLLSSNRKDLASRLEERID